METLRSDALTQEQRDAINLANSPITNPFVTLEICKVILSRMVGDVQGTLNLKTGY
jgi:phage terminase Nu1 subunit (DNA packaging protein)